MNTARKKPNADLSNWQSCGSTEEAQNIYMSKAGKQTFWRKLISHTGIGNIPTGALKIKYGTAGDQPPARKNKPLSEFMPDTVGGLRFQLSTTTTATCASGASKQIANFPGFVQKFPFDYDHQHHHHHQQRQQTLNPSKSFISQSVLNSIPADDRTLSAVATMDPSHPTSTPNVQDLLRNLGSEDDPVRKMAAFKLQSLTNDPSFAEHFVQMGGLPKLRLLILESTGNTLAYGLSSFAKLLDVDRGWEVIDNAVVEKVVELVVCQPLVNILRGAMAILVSIVSRPYNADKPANEKQKQSAGGFQALKPAIAVYPQFLEMLVSRLSSADHALCANALQLINSLMRDVITNDNETEWPKFIKRIQDLGVIKAVYVLMQSSALQDLAHPLLEFQALTKILLRRWRDVPVDLVKPEHRRTIKAIHLSSNPEKLGEFDMNNGEKAQRHNPQKWRRLGFTTESPEPDFEEMGFLGMMDLSDYVRKHQDEFQHLLMEQAVGPDKKRCPIARASLVLTSILFDHFEVDKMEQEDSKNYLAIENNTNYEKIFKPLLLHWSRLHVAGLHAFFRLWKTTGAETDDFPKIVELLRILIESVVGGADRTKGIEDIENELAAFEYTKLRELQMELLELSYEDIWGQYLAGAREELQSEALQFVREQRIRCLLEGAWFPNEVITADDLGGPVKEHNAVHGDTHNHRFIKLSADRKYLHWADFEAREADDPTIDMLRDKIDLSTVSSVVSDVTAEDTSSVKSETTIKNGQENHTKTKITIYGFLPKTRTGKGGHSRVSSLARSTSKTSGRQTPSEEILLSFQPQTHTGASEWLDGLLMLLNQQPITAETNKLVSTMTDYGLKVRLLNVRFNDEEGMMNGIDGIQAPEIPSREGLDEDYYYEI